MPGRVSNTRSVALLVVSILAIVAVALRFWARKIQKVRPKLSDYLILLGLVRGSQRCFRSVFPLLNSLSKLHQTFALAENIMCLCAIPSALALETDWGIKDIGLRPRNARDYPEAFELVSKVRVLVSQYNELRLTFRSSISHLRSSGPSP